MHYNSVFTRGLFEGDIAIVTGGGSGIGRCCAHELVSLGAEVVLVGRNEAKLGAVVEEIRRDGGQATFQSCDIRDGRQVAQAVSNIVNRYGRIDALVNNAGGQYISPLAEVSDKGWDAVVQTNLTGGFLFSRECYTQSMCHTGGAIVNVIADTVGSMPLMGHSGAARAGMLSLTETAALEWARSGVRVNAVAPGYVASSGMDHYPREAGDLIRGLAQTVPAGRFATEAEVSAAICFLLGPAASFITGTCLRVDGGRPQLRAGWGNFVLDNSQRNFGAFLAYEGFHRTRTPSVFQSSSDIDAPTAIATDSDV
ncbi:SDR family oxidoreductase [Cupriavidus sp. IDO]|uniref:SDR family oxidoreductase n=1 Tax=Cupriavidus sp. IDO TaxID=1539142 RepID=UPI00069103F2|nr:SDR family oxidoreductase [Cupriavidus sp. IDO]KWR77785.1 2,4-dienoyl-CoA reductase [Cupriavidus sp. IDO]